MTSSVSDQQQTLFSFETGVVVKVKGKSGTFTVVGLNADGSIQVFGGSRQQSRSFTQDRLKPTKPQVRGGRAQKRIQADKSSPEQLF